MNRHFGPCGVLVAILLLGGSPDREQSAPTPPPAVSTPVHKPKLVVTVSAQKSDGQASDNLEDLLMVELAGQPFLQLVNRQALRAVIREHTIALSNLNDANRALALGKFAGADYLLHVLLEKEAAAVRLVEVATGQVKLDEQVALAGDLAFSSAAIRERILAVLCPESQAVNRFTVGIAAFANRSGTSRSDKLGIALQKGLRRRLKTKTWAVVLERQYPTALLEEVDLARLGLVRGKAVETLPPADLVILGTMEDVGREYEQGKPWQVKLEVTVRLRGRTCRFTHQFGSEVIETAADAVMHEIDELRQKPLSRAAVPEKELWRRQALYLMPPRCETWCKAIVPNFFVSSEVTKLETIRAWQNILLLDADDPEAMTYLGVCMVGFHCHCPWNPASVDTCIAGSRLVERAFRSHPNDVRADTFIACLPRLIGTGDVRAKRRAREMAEYVSNHHGQFKRGSSFWVKKALNMPASESGDDDRALLAQWNRAIENARKDPDSVLLAFSHMPGQPKYPLERSAAFLKPYLDSSDPVLRFVAQKNTGELLCQQGKDNDALARFDRAIGVFEVAYQRCHRYSLFLSPIYELRMEACKRLGRAEAAKETALAGAKRFMELGCYDQAVARLYQYCVTEALGKGEEEEALAICDAYFAAFAKNYWTGRDERPIIAGKRDELLARRTGRPVPGAEGLRPVTGTQTTGLKMLRIAATPGKLWLVFGKSGHHGKVAVYRQDTGELSRVRDVPGLATSVTAGNGAVYFGAYNGIHRLDTDGRLLKHYQQKEAVRAGRNFLTTPGRDVLALPGQKVFEVCEGGGKIYFVFGGHPYRGIAVLDPRSDKVSVLAPSAANAPQPEPRDVSRLQWDAVTPRLHAFYYVYTGDYAPTFCHEFTWTPKDRKWRQYQIKRAPQIVVSDGGETLVVKTSGNRARFHFVKAGQDVTADVPSAEFVGEPAWDEHRIWASTASGLYEVDRATGRVMWLAHRVGTVFFSVIKHGGRLYLGTSDGLYYREIPPFSNANHE